MRHRLALTVAALALVLTAAGCSNGDDQDARHGQPNERDVIAAHEAADQARRDATAPPLANPDLPALADTHTGDALTEWVRTTTRLQTLGMAMRYPNPSARTVDVENVEFHDEGDQATLTVCTVSDGEVYLVATEQIASSGLRTTHTTETMTRQGNTWKLAEREVTSIDDGATCEPAG